jgi:sulfite reductase (NADPH) flavoprotein alpha-component
MLSRQEDHILKTIKDGGCIMICGSLAMQRQVLDVLESILLEHTELDLDLLQSNGQLRMDCY